MTGINQRREPPQFRKGQRVRYIGVATVHGSKLGRVTDPRDRDGWVRVRFDYQGPSAHGIRCAECNLEPVTATQAVQAILDRRIAGEFTVNEWQCIRIAVFNSEMPGNVQQAILNRIPVPFK